MTKHGLIPVVAFALSIVLLFVFNIRGSVFDPPYLQFILQVIFVFGSSIAIVVISARAYLGSGSLNVLLLGSAVLISGLASTIAAWAVSLSANEAVTIGNVGILISSFIMLLSAIFTLTGTESNVNVNRKAILVAVYFASLFLTGVLGLLAGFDLMPDFLTPTGPTLVRLVVLAVSIVLYFESCLMFGWRYLQVKSHVLYWYSLALGLFALALVAAAFTLRLGDIINWVSRLALYLSGVYFLIALLGRQAKVEATVSLSAKWAEAFRSDRKQIATFFSNMLDGFVYCRIITDKAGKPIDYVYLDANDAYERLVGVKRETILGKRATELFPAMEKDPADWIGIVGKVALTGEATTIENFVQYANIWIHASVYSPQKGYFVGIFEDITERIKAEQALEKSEQRWVTTLASIGDAVIATDADGKIMFMNGVAEELTGYTFSDANQRQLTDVFHIVNEETRQEVGNPVVKVLEKGLVVGLANHSILIRKDGTVVPIDDSGAPIKDENGKVTGIVLVFHDITERKQAEKQIESLARFPAENPDPVFRITKEGIVAYCNDGGRRILREWNCAVGQPVSANWRQLINETLALGSRREIEKKMGEEFFLFGLSPVTDYVNVYGQNITKRKLAEEKLAEYSKNLEEIVEQRTAQLKDSERLAAIGATAGMVGHDIRNPLQAITSDVYLAKTELASTPQSEEKKNALESLEEIGKNVGYINKIVADLQDYARPLMPVAKETNLQRVIDEILTKNGIPERIKVSVKVPKEASTIMADPDLIKRILNNLVTNAVQAMPEDGKLSIESLREKNDVVITVEDTGVGIPEEVRSKLFTPLFTTKSKGQGFGLAVVKRMTEALGGDVTFESQEGKGTKFIIRLPLKAKR